MKDIELPPLPEMSYLGDDASYGYDNFDMRDYARAAVEADRAQRVPDDGFAVNFVVHAGLDKHKARECERIVRELLASTPAPAQQEPDCPRCKGSGEDPEGYFDQSRGPDGDTYDGPCRDCAGTGAAQRQEPPKQERKPMTEEQDRALCEAYCNAASDEYFKARPQLDSDVNRRIFYAGHRKAWIEWQTAHGIKE